MPRVLCAGHVNWDVTLRVPALPGPDGETSITEQMRAGGGSASNTAAGFAGLGVGTLLLGSVGDDDNGRLAQRELTDAGVDCTHLQRVEGETTVKYLVVDDAGEVMVLANDGVNERFSADDLPDSVLAGIDHLHLTSQRIETAATLASRAGQAGVPVSFDPGRRLADRPYHDVAAGVDYLFLNDREATVASENGLVEAVGGSVVVTHGERGGEIRGDEALFHDGYDIDPVDTTGAGDAFAAGFLTALLDGASHRDALAVANACGAIASETVGARTQLSWDAVDAIQR